MNRTTLIRAVCAALFLCAAAVSQAAETLLSTVEAFVAARDGGDDRRALAIARRVLDHSRQDPDSDGETRSYLLESVAAFLADVDRWDEAEALLRESLRLRQAAVGPWHGSLASLLDGLTNALVLQERAAEAEPFVRRALAIRERDKGPESLEAAMTLWDLAEVYGAQGRKADAERLTARAEAIAEAHGPLPDFATAAGAATEGPAACRHDRALVTWCALGKGDRRRQAGLSRFPTVEAPERVVAGVPFAVQVSLTEDEITPQVRLRPAPGGSATDAGALRLDATGGTDGVTIDVVLSASGFDFPDGRNKAAILVPRDGDSTPALFTIVARAEDALNPQRKIFATLWRDGAYLARLTRAITVTDRPRPTAAADRAGEAVPWNFDTAAGDPASEPVRLDEAFQAPDLTVFLFGGGEGGEAGQVIVQSPHLQVSRHGYATPRGLRDWLAGQYAAMLRLAAQRDPDRRRMQGVAFMGGFGAKLWREFAPIPVKEAFWLLDEKLGEDFRSVQVYTDDPSLPWELMRPARPGAEPRDFLGVTHRIARWHVSDSGDQLGRPPQGVAIANLLAVAPAYKGRARLPAQAREMETLSSVAGFRQIPGDFEAFSALIADRPDGTIHFSGHGQVREENGAAEYAILLGDGALDLTTWRGLAAGRGLGSPLFFFNACDIGRADRVANFVDGWAPAVLEAGASGYIGGLWPLSDSGAYDFAATFYGALEKDLRTSPVYIADLLRQARTRFYDTGDPTYLAYGFYGDVNLRLDRDWGKGM